MKRILHIPNYYYPHIGGIEQVCQDIVKSLDGKYEQKVICFKDEKKTAYDKVEDIEVVRVGCIAKVASQSIAPTYNKELKKIMNEFKPDIVIFHYPNPFVAHSLLKYRNKNFKLIIYWHLDIIKQKILGKFFNNQTKKLLNWATNIVATSPNYIEGSKFLQMYKHKTIVIPNCVDTKRLLIDEKIEERAKQIKEENKNNIICLNIGRHVSYKGIEYLIEASKFLPSNYRIYLAGQGPLTDSLKNLAANDEKIKFLGRISDIELKAYLLACDIYCFPSITKNEAFGLALAEAMYYGKPSVTFTIPGSGVNYVNINNETGYEVSNRDSKAFANAVLSLGEDSNLRKELGNNAKNRVLKLFTSDDFKSNIIKFIDEVSK